MQRIIGLDIGSYSIKAVEIVNHFKSYEITNFYENVIPSFDEVSADTVIPACMEQLFTENNIKADRIITAMQGQYISSRILSFNFSDPRKIAASLMAEVEDVVPFNLDSMIIDHQVLGEKDGKTIALVVMTRKKFLASFLEHLQRIDIDPKLVDVDSLAFYNLCPYLDMEPGKCYGIIDVGHEKTSVCIVQDGVLRMFRSINLGGRYLTEFLARDLEVSFNEAQRIKHEVSRVFHDDSEGEGLSDRDRVVAERTTLACNSIIKEIGRTFYAFKTWEKNPIDSVFLSGGTARIKNFDKYLSSHLEVEVVASNLEYSALKINPSLSDKMITMAQGISIGMRAIVSNQRRSKINLRRGEFSYVQNYESLLQGAGTAFKVIAFALVLLSIAYVFKYKYYNGLTTDIQGQYAKVVKSEFPTLSKKYRKKKPTFKKMQKDSRSYFSTTINSKRDAREEFASLYSGSGPLAGLLSISKILPKEMKVSIIRYKFTASLDGKGKLIIEGDADSHATVSEFVELLGKAEYLSDIEKKSSKPKAGSQDVIRFVIHGSYAPEEDDEV